MQCNFVNSYRLVLHQKIRRGSIQLPSTPSVRQLTAARQQQIHCKHSGTTCKQTFPSLALLCGACCINVFFMAAPRNTCGVLEHGAVKDGSRAFILVSRCCCSIGLNHKIVLF